LWVSVTGSPVLARVNQSAALSRMRRDAGRFAVAPVRKRLPSAKSMPGCSIAASSAAMATGECWPSASNVTSASACCSRA
jgi:hypothetical protein